ncbi:MAG: hypothetical protein ABSF71_32520 [Terriglobia bacterium]|jgi:hypothetical protein
MKAKSIRSFLQVLFFVALALALAPRAASALDNQVGKFTLPFEVHWGGAVLPAGSYRISADSLNSATLVNVYKENSPSAGFLIPAIGWDSTPASYGKVQLVIDHKNGEAYVKELKVGSEGVALYYAAPKLKK